MYYELDAYQIPEEYSYNGYIKEAVNNIRKGNEPEYYKDTLFRMTYPTAITELKKYSNIDEVDELLPIMSISFMKTINKFDPENPKVSFMNYYKRTMHNDVILAYTKHRCASEEVQEFAKRAEKTKAYFDELVHISGDDYVPLYDLVEDDFVIDEELLFDDFKKTIFKVIESMFKLPKEEKKKKIFDIYISDRLEDKKTPLRELAKEIGTTQSYVSRIIIDYTDELAKRLKREGYTW